MKILLIGASGMIGAAILSEASGRGHSIFAVARHPQNIDPSKATTVKGADGANRPELEPLVRDVDVIVSSVSPRGEGDQTEQALGVARTLAGLAAAHDKRLVVVGGAGSLKLADGTPVLDTLPELYQGEARAMRAVLDLLKSSPVDWTFFSPAALIEPGAKTGQFRLGHDTLLVDGKGKSRISVEDFASALVDELEIHAHGRQQMTIGY